uniref:CalM n=1 Tax=uncultured Candidatus Entotheonella sp. TaxID=312019 RepID=A0A068PC09_9BACT|nr:CalM [uncultured Candidatus Entotheonella sp.]
MNKQGEVIMLNGAHCAGKTTLAREVQKLAERPILATGYYDYLWMLALKYVGLDPEIRVDGWPGPDPGLPQTQAGFEILREGEGENATFRMMCGEIGWNVMYGMRRSFAAMANAGNDLVLGEVNTEIMLKDYCNAFKDLERVYMIGVFCPLEELERREDVMPHRRVGCARMQIDQVHMPGAYDFTVDTGKDDAEECARQVLNFVDNNPPVVFKQLVERYGEIEEVNQFPVQWW